MNSEKLYASFLINSFYDYVGNRYHENTTKDMILDIYKRIRKEIMKLENISDNDLIFYLNELKDIKNNC